MQLASLIVVNKIRENDNLTERRARLHIG